ncbi:MAG: hypothetical protein QOJ99_4885 [Bryobacterales bacterium]|jgi:hypothetical protein|nr:hypothetical protein [Bryobacterales bacterium]
MRILSALLTGCLIVSALWAQSDRGSITGTVTDPANAIVPGVAITAVHAETAAQYQTVTTATGNYTIPSLPAGLYNITVEAPGFKKLIQSGVTVEVAQTARIDLALQVGAASESVTVSADATLLKTESAEQSTTISSERINALPLNFAATQGGAIRNPLAFVALSPGAWIQPGSQNTIRINGAPNTSFKIMLEGQDATNGLTQATTNHNQPSVEAIQEFTLQTSNFAAEYGQVSGGLFNFTAKSGTNRFHSAVYDYFVNEDLNAGQPFTDSGNGHLIRPPNKKNDFGGTLGGPVVIPKIYNGRDKTFFFFNLEAYVDRKVISGQLITVPTLAMRSGDFSSALTRRQLAVDPLGRPIFENTIYNPATQRVENGAVVRDPFPNNLIPASMFDPVALRIQNLIPLPTNPGVVNNYSQFAPNPRTQIIDGVKVDHSFSGSSKLSFYVQHYTSHEYSSADGLPAPVTAFRDKHVSSTTVRLNYDQTVTPTFLIHAGIGEQRFHNPDTSPSSVLDYDAVSALGLVGSATNPAGFPRINGLLSSYGGFGGTTANSLGPSNANSYFTDKPTAILNATLVQGSHTYKAGAEFRIDAFTDRNTRGSQGIYNFTAVESGLPSTNGQNLGGGNVGFPYASFLLGAVNNATVNSPQDPQFRKTSWSIFVQDTWKITRKISLDYGLRYDRQSQGGEIHDRLAEFSPSTPNPAAGGLPGATIYSGYGQGRCNCSFTKTYPYALGPRLGIAFQLDSKTVLRAGWGITYGTTGSYNYITNSPVLGVGFNQLSFTSPSYGDAATVLRNGLQYNPASLYAASLNPGIRPDPGQINTPPYWIDPNGGRPPRIMQWSIGLQREITKDLLLEAAWVGNRGAWLQANSLIDLNGSTAKRIAAAGLDINNPADRTLLTSRLDSALAQSRGFKAPYAGYPLSLTVGQTLRPFPQFGSIPVWWAPLGNNWYDSLQVKLTKRYSHGLTLSSAFTWQKELVSGAEAETGSAVPVNDVYNRSLQKYISAFSQPLVLVTGFSYQLPAIGPTRWIKAVIRDWTAGGILRYSSGLPILAPAANNALNALLFRNTSAATFANRVPGEPLFLQDLNCHCFDPNSTFILNPKAWVDPPAGQFGTSAAYYNDYRGARRPDESLSLGRSFPLREGMTFQLRAEFFNPFNRTYLNAPDSTNAAATQKVTNGQTVSGFGRINNGSTFLSPRNGQLVARFQW